jgi:dienelactone hydrolase
VKTAEVAAGHWRPKYAAYLAALAEARAGRFPRRFATKAEWLRFRARLLRGLRGMAGFPPRRVPAAGRVLAVERVEGVRREEVDFEVDGYFVKADLYLPSSESPCPAMIVSPGYLQSKREEGYPATCLRWAKAGFASLVVEHPAADPSQEGAGLSAGEVMWRQVLLGDLLGRPHMLMESFEMLRGLDYLQTRREIAARRVGATGLCQGAICTWFAGALEPRFRLVAPVCVTTYAAWATDYHAFAALSDSSPYPPGLLRHGDVQHVLAAIAPRPLLGFNNMGDQWWPGRGWDQVNALCRNVYRLLGAPERFQLLEETHWHRLDGPFADRILEWMQRYLA